jgi:hypothetical protein
MSDSPAKCENCRFFHLSEEAATYGVEHGFRVYGRCRRYAPGAMDSKAYHSNREVSPDDWCGDWESPGPDNFTKVLSDFLEENGHPEAAATLRRFAR